MSGVATAVVVGSAITAKSNKDAAKTAAGARPKFAREVVPGIERQMGRTAGTGISPFRGDRVAGFSPYQQQAIGGAGSLADSLQGQQATVGEGFGDFASGAMVGDNPFLQQAIEGMRETSLRDLTRNQLPAIRNTAVETGGIGGSRQGIAEGLALSDMNRDLINTESGLRANQLNMDLSNQLQALTNQGQILSGQTDPMELLLRTGALQQGQEQAEIGGEMAAHDEQQNLQFNRDQELLRILLGAPAAMAPIPAQSNPLAAGLGAGMTVSQLFPNQAPAQAQTVGTTASGAGTGGTFNLVPNQRGFVGGF